MYKLLLFLGCLASVNALNAQPPKSKKVLADKIIGQVGDRIILRSDIINAIADYKRQAAADLPPNPECSFLEGQLIQKALILQAEKDSLPVSDEQVEAEIEAAFASGGEANRQHLIGRTGKNLASVGIGTDSGKTERDL